MLGRSGDVRFRLRVFSRIAFAYNAVGTIVTPGQQASRGPADRASAAVTGGSNDVSRNAAGVAAVEFALILPLLILIYAGVVDLTRTVIESRKVQTVSKTIADLVSQQSTQKQLSPETLASILTAATAIMAPYPATAITMTVSAINLRPKSDGTCCDATVLWSYAQGGALRPCGVFLRQVPSTMPPAPDTIPAAIVQNTVLGPFASAAITIADVHDTYRPIFGPAALMLSGGMARTTYASPRGNGQLNVTQPFIPIAGHQAVACL